MRRDIALAGFVLTGDEWERLDDWSRSQLLLVALRHDGGWIAGAPPPDLDARAAESVDVYEAYELVLGAA